MPTRKLVATAIPLKAFAEPDTSSHVETRLPVGEYIVLSTKELTNTTFVEVRSPLIHDGTAWLCIKSAPAIYGRIITREIAAGPRDTFVDDNFAISETDLKQTLSAFVGYGYDLHDPRYPSQIASMKLPLAPPNVNNCCTFVEALIAGTFARLHHDVFKWDRKRHAQMMIDSADDYYSPITALLESGAAVPAPMDKLTPPSPWTVFQGWKTKWSGGHTFIVVDHHVDTDKVLILESNCTSELNGVGYRGIGRLTAQLDPPERWWELPKVWTWERLSASYPLRRRCIVRVKQRALSQLA
jgi:hypothetical protein